MEKSLDKNVIKILEEELIDDFVNGWNEANEA